MYKLLILMTLSIFLAAPSFAGGTAGCRSGHFVGSYITSPNSPTDLFGNGTVIHTYAYQLTLTSDGSATQYWTGLPDYILTLGTASPWIGSWKCRIRHLENSGQRSDPAGNLCPGGMRGSGESARRPVSAGNPGSNRGGPCVGRSDR